MELTMSINDDKTEYQSFITQSDEDLKDNILTVYSIITGINLTTMDNIYSALDNLLGEPVDTTTLPKAISIARNYLFETNPKIKDIASMIESMSNDNIDTFIDTIVSIANGTFYDLNKIGNIDKYELSIDL